MFTRLFAQMRMRRSTAFLLSRADDRLLDDIGLTRAELCAALARRPAGGIEILALPGAGLPVSARG